MPTTLRATVLDYRMLCKSKRLDAQTMRWYDQKLAVTLDHLEQEGVTTVEELTAPALHQAIAAIGEQTNRYGRPVSGATVAGYVQVIKGWLTYLVDEELIGPRIRKRIEKPQIAHRLVKTLSEAHFQELVGAANHEMVRWLMLRDRAVLQVLWETGLRAAELCRLRRSDVDIEPDPHVHVLWGSKRQKEREVGPLSFEGCRAISRYLRAQPRASGDVLFVRRYHQQLTVSGLEQLCYRLRDWAGLSGVEVRPHVFRHTYAVNALRAGMDIKRLSLLLGHSSVVVTENYLRDFEQREARRRAGGSMDRP